MVDYTQNPFFGNPYIEQTGANLIKAFNDDGRGAVNQSHKRLLDAQTEKATGENRGREAAATAVQGFDPTQPITMQFLQNVHSNMIRAGIPSAQASAAILSMTANGGAPDPVVARAFVGSGNAIGKDQSFSEAGREAVAKRENDAAFGRTKYSADSSAGAHLQGIRISNQFQEDHPTSDRVKGKYLQTNPDQVPAAIFAPHNVPAGGQANYAPGDPRATGPVVEGPPTADRYVKAFDPNSPSGGSYQKAGPGVPTPVPVEKELTLTPNAAADMKFAVLQSIPGAISPDGKAIDPEFNRQYGEKIQAAEIAAATEYKRTRDAAAAGKVFKDTLGIKPGSDFQQGGLFGRWGGSGLFDATGNRVAPAKTADGLPSGTAQDAPVIAPQFATPPAGKSGQAPAAGPAGPASAALDEARAAIAKGANRAAVMQRLRQNGIDPSPLSAPQNANDGAR